MRFLWIIFIFAFTAVLAEEKRRRKFEGDFEFADEVDSKSSQKSPAIPERKKWIHDPDSELCKPLNCKKKEICLLDESSAAFCVSKKEIHKNGDIIVPKSKATEAPPKNEDDDNNEDDENDDDEDDEDDDDIFYDSEDGQGDEDEKGSALKCKTCPIVKPVFLCGNDNRTYSSLCRLDYHNCLHKSHVKVSCKGFCPCKETDSLYKKKQKQAEKMNNLMSKYRNTVEKEKGVYGKYKPDKEKSEKKLEGKKYTGVSLYGPSPSKGFMKWDLPVHKYQQIRNYKHDDSRFSTDDGFDDMYQQKLKNKWMNKKYYDEDKSHNEVIKTKTYRPGKDCSPSALQSMGNRLLDWFSVVMSESKRKKQHKIKGDLPGWCKSEVRWMFGYLDLDGDEKLSLTELYHMEHDHKEKCVKPFVDSCDSNRDIFISPKEWCHCFDKTDRPCAAVKRRLTPDLLGAYVPDCDSQGYFHPTQCHNSVGMCWCVDKHGVELPNSRTRGRPSCDALMKKSKGKDSSKKEEVSDKVNIDDEDEDDEGGNDSDLEGSADQPLDF